MEYIIQENLFREEHYELLHQSLDRFGLKHTTVRVFPFVDKVSEVDKIPDDFHHVEELPEFEPIDKNKIFVFGSIKFARIAKERNWKIGSLANDNHDYEVYSKHYKDNLLNYDSEIIRVGDIEEFDWKDGEEYFIRPTLDSKALTGAVFEKIEFFNLLHRIQGYDDALLKDPDSKLQITIPKEIHKEIRFFVVDGKVVTGSQYRLGNQLVLDGDVEPEAIEFAQSMVNIFQLAEGFVIDVCHTPDGWKIVECGCINCAGFYKSDIQKLIIALEDKFNY